MFDHLDAGPSRDQGRRRADVKGAGAIPSRAAGIQHFVPAHIQADHVLSQHGGGGPDFFSRFSFDSQAR